MRKINHYLTYVIAGVLSVVSSCQEKVDVENPSDEKVRLNVKVHMEDTKVLTEVNETAIKNYQVYVFNENERLEAYVNSNSPDIILECTPGKKTVAVLANAPELTQLSMLGSFKGYYSELNQNSPDAFVMEGMATVTIEKRTDNTVTVPVSRHVAKIELASLVVNFDIPTYNNLDFKVSEVFLINVPASKEYFHDAKPHIWYNKRGYVDTDPNELIYDNMNNVVVTSTKGYTRKNVFYCYPNPQEEDDFRTDMWTYRHTRLVVKAEFLNNVYYYPVTLPVIEQNKHYQVSLTITRLGAESPDAVVKEYPSDFSVTVTDWGTPIPVPDKI